MSGETARPTRIIIPYVRVRMVERGVTEEAIDWVLENYHTSRPAGSRPGSKPSVIYVGDWEGRNLRIYVERDSDPPKIKTVAWED